MRRLLHRLFCDKLDVYSIGSSGECVIEIGMKLKRLFRHKETCTKDMNESNETGMNPKRPTQKRPTQKRPTQRRRSLRGFSHVLMYIGLFWRSLLWAFFDSYRTLLWVFFNMCCGSAGGLQKGREAPRHLPRPVSVPEGALRLFEGRVCCSVL